MAATKTFGFKEVLEAIDNSIITHQEAVEMLEEAGEIIFPVMKKELKNVIGKDSIKPELTGQLLQTLGTSEAKSYGDHRFNIKVGFWEPRRHRNGKTTYMSSANEHGVRSEYEFTNAMVANILENGSSTQKARPWLTRTVYKTKYRVNKHLQKSLEDKFNK